MALPAAYRTAQERAKVDSCNKRNCYWSVGQVVDLRDLLCFCREKIARKHTRRTLGRLQESLRSCVLLQYLNTGRTIVRVLRYRRLSAQEAPLDRGRYSQLAVCEQSFHIEATRGVPPLQNALRSGVRALLSMKGGEVLREVTIRVRRTRSCPRDNCQPRPEAPLLHLFRASRSETKRNAPTTLKILVHLPKQSLKGIHPKGS